MPTDAEGGAEFTGQGLRWWWPHPEFFTTYLATKNFTMATLIALHATLLCLHAARTINIDAQCIEYCTCNVQTSVKVEVSLRTQSNVLLHFSHLPSCMIRWNGFRRALRGISKSSATVMTHASSHLTTIKLAAIRFQGAASAA